MAKIGVLIETEKDEIKKTRITSYNVCYTKLLRISTILSDPMIMKQKMSRKKRKRNKNFIKKT